MNILFIQLTQIPNLQVIAVIVVYVTVVVFLWKQENSFYFMLLGQTLWVVLVAYGCSFLGALQVPLFLASLTYALVGVVYDYKARFQRTGETNDANLTIVDKVVSLLDVPNFYTTGDLTTPLTSPNTTAVLASVEEIAGEGGAGDSAVGDDLKAKLHLDVKTPLADLNLGEEPVVRRSQSEIYFRALFLACIATVFYNHVWMLFVVLVPILVFVANKAIVAFCVVDVVRTNWTDLTGGIRVCVLLC